MSRIEFYVICELFILPNCLMMGYLAFALKPVTPVTENANEHSIVLL